MFSMSEARFTVAAIHKSAGRCLSRLSAALHAVWAVHGRDGDIFGIAGVLLCVPMAASIIL